MTQYNIGMDDTNSPDEFNKRDSHFRIPSDVLLSK